MKPLSSFIRDRIDLADALSVSVKKLDFLVEAPAERKYSKFLLFKKNGGIRIIEAPNRSLKFAQKKLLEILNPYYSPLPCVHGFVAEKSILTGAVSHSLRSGRRAGAKRKHRYYFLLDIENFFPSITSQRIYGLLVGKRLRATPEVAFAISKLSVGEFGLAQGSPVSPLLSNMICLGMDRKVLAFAKKYKLVYTRYADDIVLSTSNRRHFLDIFCSDNKLVPYELERAITEHNGQKSFRINENKVRCRMPYDCQLVTGLVMNEKINIPRKYYRTLRACLHTWNTFGKEKAVAKYYQTDIPTKEEISSFEESVRGKLDYYRAVVSNNEIRCTSLEKLGSLFNRCCEGRRFPIHRPEDSLFIIRAYSSNGIDFSEGVAFLLDRVGIVTARHLFDEYSFDGVPIKITLTSIVNMNTLETNVVVKTRSAEEQYDCVKLEFSAGSLSREFPFATPLFLTDFYSGKFPAGGEIVIAFDIELVSDADQGIREYSCTEITAPCKKPSSPNQYGRMSQIVEEEFYIGMSGGPVLNQKGEVLGIVKSGIERGSGSRNARSKFLYLDRLESIPYGVSPKA